MNEIERLQARVAVLEAGLRPFAEYAAHTMPRMRDEVNVATITNTDKGDVAITLGDLRRARALLLGVPATKEEQT